MISWGGRYFSDCNLVAETSITILLEVSELSRRILHTKYCEDSASTSSAEK